jgi:plasmid stability protein
MWSAITVTKNITLAIDEDLLDRARVIAAMKRTSVNAMIREFLEHTVEAEKGKDAAREELLRLIDESEAKLGGYAPQRADGYATRKHVGGHDA